MDVRKKIIFLCGLQAFWMISCTPNGYGVPTPADTPKIESFPNTTQTPTAVKTAVTLYPVDTPTTTPSSVPDALYVKADSTLGAISPFIYGTNFGPWQNLSNKALPQLEDAGIRFLRYPGGAYGDEYAFVEERLDGFMELAGRLGAEPMVNVKLRNSTPKSAAQVVQYANVEMEYGIRYWAIGNEPDLYSRKYRMAEYDTESFNREWRAFALAMKAIDSSIVLIGPEISQFTGDSGIDPKDRNGKDWLREFLRENGDLVDIVSIHRYPFGSTETTVSDLRNNSAEWDSIIPNLRYIIHNELGRDLPVAVTEVNSDWSSREGGESTPDSFYNAVWFADVLGRLGRQQVDIAAQFCLEGAGGLGMTRTSTVRPITHVYTLYARFGSERVYASSDTEFLNVFGAKTNAGILTLMIVSMDSQAVSKTVRIEGMEFQPTAETWRFDSLHNAEQLEATVLNDRDPIVFPAESVTLLIVRPVVP